MKKILVCDLDGTLVEFSPIQKIPWNQLRVACLGMVTWLFSFLQVRWSQHSTTYKKIQGLGIDFVVVSGRTHFLREPYKTVNKLLNTDLKKEEIFLRNGKYGFFESRPDRFKHKEDTIKKLQEKYEVVAVVEDEPKARHKLKEKVQVPIIPPDPEEIEKLEI